MQHFPLWLFGNFNEHSFGYHSKPVLLVIQKTPDKSKTIEKDKKKIWPPFYDDGTCLKMAGTLYLLNWSADNFSQDTRRLNTCNVCQKQFETWKLKPRKHINIFPNYYYHYYQHIFWLFSHSCCICCLFTFLIEGIQHIQFVVHVARIASNA